MHISDKTHRLKDQPTTIKPKEKGPKTIKINKKKAKNAFLKLDNEINQTKLHKYKKSQTSNKKKLHTKNSKKNKFI